MRITSDIKDNKAAAFITLSKAWILSVSVSRRSTKNLPDKKFSITLSREWKKSGCMRKVKLSCNPPETSSMSFDVLTTSGFKKDSRILLKKYGLLKNEITDLIASLEENPEQGALLGRGCFKIRGCY